MSEALDFSKKVITRWQPPATWNDAKIEAWSQDVMQELSGLSSELLDEMLKVLVRTWTFRGTPEVGDILKVVKPARNTLDLRKQSGELKLQAVAREGEKIDGYWRTDRVKLAYDLLQTEPGRRAAREGYIHGFWTYVIEYGTAPDDKAINQRVRGYTKEGKPIHGLKEAARLHAELMEDLAKNNTSLGKRLYAIGTVMVARGLRLAEIAEGKNVPSLQQYWRECFGKFEKLTVDLKSSPASKYADENAAEGRGWKGRTA